MEILFYTELKLDTNFQFYLNAVHVSNANSERQAGGGHTQRYTDGRHHRRAADVAQRETSVLSKAACNRAGKTRAAPETIAT